MDSVVHFDIPADDVARAKKFYSSMFGWKLGDVPGMDYTMAVTTETDEATQMPKKPGAINGGIVKRQKPGDGPIIAISVSSIDDHLKKAVEHGGMVKVPKMPVGDMGLYACIIDTEGNTIALWQNLK